MLHPAFVFDLTARQSVQNNGTLWADIYLVKNSSHPDPKNSAFHPENVHHIRKSRQLLSCSRCPSLTFLRL